MPFIDVIDYEDAHGKLKTIYDDLIQSRGKLAEVHKIQSLNPESIINHMDLYMTIMFGKSPLKRATREMIAVVVSRANECSYCQQHHIEALNHYWKDDFKCELFRNDFMSVDLESTELALCQYAKALTIAPGKHTEEKYIAPLRNCGLTDRAILDATLVIGYFNFVNRIVLGLGVNLENDDHSGGYNY